MTRAQDDIGTVDGEDLRRFAAMRAGFERTCAHAAVSQSTLALAGTPVRLRIAGRALAAHIAAPFAQLRRDSAPMPPSLAIDLWDARECGVEPSGDLRASGRTWDLGNGSFTSSDGARFTSHTANGGIAWFDREAKHIVGCYADGESLTLHQRVRPLQMLLALWASDRGLQPVHAALVARQGRGVLLAGQSGSGKSTTALACLEAGYTFLGDDWIALEFRSQAIIGHGLYASAALAPDHARRFPFLRPHLVPLEHEAKTYALLAQGFADHLGEQARIVALALPRVAETSESSAHPAAARDALLRLAPNTILAMEPRGGRQDFARLATLARLVPAWTLAVGRRIDGIPGCLDTLLATSPL